jgi:hypothetical protein
MLAKNFERFMKNNKFKKFSDRLKKAPHTAEPEEVRRRSKGSLMPKNAQASGTSRLNVQI